MYFMHMEWRALSYVIVTVANFAKIIMRSLHYYVELCVLLAHHSVLSRVLWRSETPRQLECDYYKIILGRIQRSGASPPKFLLIFSRHCRGLNFFKLLAHPNSAH